MLGFEEDRLDFDVEFNGKEYRVNRERIDLGDSVYEKIGVFDEEGLVIGLEYEKENAGEFEMLSQRDDNEVEVYERGNPDASLDEFEDLYSTLQRSQDDFQMDRELNGAETAEYFQ